jgi:hypothetical protein
MLQGLIHWRKPCRNTRFTSPPKKIALSNRNKA